MYSKLIVDGKTVYVFKDSNVPKWIKRLRHMQGVKIFQAREIDRIPFEQLEDKLREQRKLDEKYT